MPQQIFSAARLAGFPGAWLGLCALGLAACSSSAAPVDGGLRGLATPGQPCARDQDCQSGACGGGTCCTSACGDPAFPSCSYCDSAGGCQYTQAVCHPQACDPVARVASSEALCAQGTCPSPSVTQCPGGCSGSVCGSGCLQDTDCGASLHCVNLLPDAGGDGGLTRPPLGTCEPKGTGGEACAHADECSSGQCLGGHCCRATCTADPAHPECSVCDSAGACDYPEVVCASAACDPVANAYVPASTCSAGHCAADAGPIACQLAACTPAAACDPQARCSTDSDCASNAYCEQTLGGQCCEALQPGGSLFVDIALGTDQGCCGSTPQTPCKSLTHAIALYLLAQGRPGGETLTSVTLEARVNGGAGDWASNGDQGNPDQSPTGLLLPSGVTLHAPGVYFAVPLAVYGGQVTLLGDPDLPLFLGIDSAGGQPLTPFANGVVILYFDGFQTLEANGNLSAAAVPGRLRLSNVSFWEGLEMQGEVVLGEDQTGDAGGPVLFGNPNIFVGVSVPAGIVIDSPGICLPSNRSTLRDHPGLANSLEISGLTNSRFSLPGILIGDCADVDLEDSPYLGPPPGELPDGGAAAGDGIQVGTNSNVVLSGARLTNTAHAALLINQGSNSSVQLRDSDLSFNRCSGLEVAGPAQVNVSASRLEHNYYNLVVDASAGAAKLDLTTAVDAGSGAHNTIACSDPGLLARLGFFNPDPLCSNNQGAAPGIDLWDLSAAANVLAPGVAWTHQPPVVTPCDPNFSSCSQPTYDVVVSLGATPSLPAPLVAATCSH